MNRRTLITTVASIGLAGCSTFQREEPQEATAESVDPTKDEKSNEIPEDVEALEPLAISFTETIHQYYPDARVFVIDTDELAMDYETTAESSDALETEFHQIADEYAAVVEEHDPATLSILTSEVQAIVPEVGVGNYAEGELETDAFHQTIEVTDVNRQNE